jgi:hypothetical protein
MRVAPEFSAAAAVLSGAVYSGHRLLAELVREGERGQALRNAEGLGLTSRRVLDLPLGEDAYWIGKYYEALAANRLGNRAFAEANEILIEVSDHGPELFRAKALVAIGTNLYYSGDRKAALQFYRDADRIARSCEYGGLKAVTVIRFQIAVIAYVEGDHRGALTGFEALWPLALQLGLECPATLHHYYNNLAVTLAASNRLDEALCFAGPIAESPFSAAYPEWEATHSALLKTTRTRSGSVVSVSAPLPRGADQSAPLSPGALLRHPITPAATAPVGGTRPHVPSPAALAWARIATGRLCVSLRPCRDLPARHLSFLPTAKPVAPPPGAIRLNPEQVRERRPVIRPSARAPPPTSAC